MSARTTELTATKQAILRKRLRGGAHPAAGQHAIPRRAQPEEAPLSFAQQRLWFLHELEPRSPLYNMPIALRLTGRLDVRALERSLAAIVARHEVLRTRFVARSGSPAQIVHAPTPVPFHEIDLRAISAPEREAKLPLLLVREARQPFDLARDLMLRAALVRLGEQEHVLLLTLHHIASDGWSWSVFFRELSLHYRGFHQGVAPVLPELPIQYADYALWQRGLLQGDTSAKHVAHWRQCLAGAPDFLELPTDHPRPAVQAFRGAVEVMEIPCEVCEGIRTLGRREGATLFMSLLAAFATLLHRYTMQEDILIGSPVAGRDRVETEDLIGFFINTLVLRCGLSGNPTFRQLLKRVRAQTLDAYTHAELPFEKLVEELRPERSPGHSPLIQVLFALQNQPEPQWALPDLTIQTVEVSTATAKFDLTLAINQSAKHLTAAMEYNTDLFNAATIRRMLGHYRRLLEGITADPDQTLGALPLLTEPERHQILVDWNATDAEFPAEKPIHQLFEEQVRRTPDAPAVISADSQLTYAELNTRANRLAHRLMKLGIGPDIVVGICMERSLDLVVGLLGILKAGGAYLPLDPAYPQERLAFMLEDARAPVLLTQESLAVTLPERRLQVLKLDTDWPSIERETSVDPSPRVNGENLAYVMYTSGSTGRPKGVCIPQRAVNRLVINTDYVRLQSSDVVGQISNTSFDAATFELWGALLNGARLAIIDREALLAPEEFARQLRRHHVSALFVTTALFNQLIRQNPMVFHSVHHLMIGGDAVDPQWAREVLWQGFPGRLLNGYGPTETTTFAAWHHIQAVAADTRNIPIGRPIANTRIYLVDPHLNPVPIGVPGELLIGGPGLARGYLNQEELTIAKFIPNPFSSDPEARLYRTGDRARYRPDGCIEFLGRMDQQVKIRGFRIELEEIETVLGLHPAVADCVVLAHEHEPGDKRLAAYVVLRQSFDESLAAELRSHLQTKLPDYMVPAVFMPLERLPLTPNGKVDRRTLPVPDTVRLATRSAHVAPRDAVETDLARIWEQVLGVRPVGVTDKFFELGGHSLLAVQLVARMEETFGCALPVTAVFQSPTVEQLAGLLRAGRDSATESSVVEIQPHGSRPPLFLVHGVGGGMFWGYNNLARCLGFNQPVYAFKSRGLDGREEFARVEDMAAQYVSDLLRFQPAGPYHLGGYCFGGDVAYEMARQLTAQGHTIALLALMNCAPPNSSYARARLTPRLALKFLRNLLHWVGYLLRIGPEKRRDFFRWKWRTWTKRARRLLGLSPSPTGAADVDDLVDLAAFTEDQRKLWETHTRALIQYHPQPYTGQVTLFRTSGHAFWCSFDDECGWGELASGGVTVKIIPGEHESILEEPNVRTLAAELAFCLAPRQEGKAATP